VYADSNSNRDCNAYGYANIHAYSYTYPNTQYYTNSDSHSYSDIHDYSERYGDSYSYGKANAHRSAQRDAEATSYRAAAPEPVAVIWFKERSLVRRPNGADWKPAILEYRINAVGPITCVIIR
jgi:hypothetical protein